jgi:pimeloyl-ACP methyl ester carboxylesterase
MQINMQSFFFPYRSSLVHYQKAGTGSRILFCFHGYGENAESFSFLEEPLEAGFTMICMDLPFHGKTNWQEGFRFTARELVSIMEGIAQEQELMLSRFSITGFSMGGRVAMGLVPLLSGQIEKLLLIAPDGLKMNFWYWLATQNAMGNRFFRFTVNHPRWLFASMKIGYRFGLVNPSIYKFSKTYLEVEQERQDLYRRWTTMRRFGCPQAELKRQIREHKIAVEMVYGEHDRMILSETGMKFRQGIEDQCRITILPSGHQLLLPKNAKAIVSLL